MWPNKRLLCLAITLATSLSGCHLHDAPAEQRVPAVSTRFTSSADNGKKKDPVDKAEVPTLPALRVGLVMQSSVDSVHTQFAGSLGTVLSRELQLSSGSMTVQPLASLEAKSRVPQWDTQPSGNVISVSFTDAQDTLPSQMPPNPMLMALAPPVVDQILVVRVIEYRAYFPLLATLELRVLDGETQDPIFATTATWSGVDYRLAETQNSRTWRDRILCRESTCDPSPSHNSPQALMHEISLDITDWYNQTLTTGLPQQRPGKTSKRNRWMSPFRKDTCDSCDSKRMSRSDILNPAK